MKILDIPNLPSIICFIGATIVAATGHDGWGWLIFAGILVSRV